MFHCVLQFEEKGEKKFNGKSEIFELCVALGEKVSLLF